MISNGQRQTPNGPAIVLDIDQHLKAVSRLLRTAPMLFSPELFRVVLLDLADVVASVADHANEAPAPPPFLFRDRIVCEALHLWEQQMRRALLTAVDRRHPPEADTKQDGAP